MCTEVHVLKNGDVVECDTMGQLAVALGIAISDIPKFGDFEPEPDDCLCAVQWGKFPTARQATDAEGWPFPEYIVESPNA